MFLHFQGKRNLEMKRENIRSHLASCVEPYLTRQETSVSYKGKGKVKFTLEQATKTQRWRE
jgi:hypothetical protein